MRMDIYMADAGYAESRTAAKNLILEGMVFVNGKRIDKPSYQVSGTEEIQVEDNRRFVSRGGEKLSFAIEFFKIDVQGKTAIDIGASSGGFTDCLLQNGARFVYAIDSGTNQLVKSLREDERVESRENCNARYLKKEDFDKKTDIAVMDVSFISQKLILPTIYNLLDGEGILISLIKPQFEVGRSGIGKGGIVKDDKLRETAKGEVIKFAENIGFICVGTTISPIKGGDGNMEYLACFRKK